MPSTYDVGSGAGSGEGLGCKKAQFDVSVLLLYHTRKRTR
jgi:hypothetical protein